MADMTGNEPGSRKYINMEAPSSDHVCHFCMFNTLYRPCLYSAGTRGVRGLTWGGRWLQGPRSG